MWMKIRSSFILKRIFKFINNNKKFNIIIYNKKMQKNLGLDLLDFIRFSGKYSKNKYNTLLNYSFLPKINTVILSEVTLRRAYSAY